MRLRLGRRQGEVKLVSFKVVEKGLRKSPQNTHLHLVGSHRRNGTVVAIFAAIFPGPDPGDQALPGSTVSSQRMALSLTLSVHGISANEMIFHGV